MTPAERKAPAPWWVTCPPIGFTAEAWKRVAQMSQSREARTISSVQGLQEAKLLGKARSAMRLDH